MKYAARWYLSNKIKVQPFPVFAGLVDMLLFDKISAIECANDGFSATIRTFTILRLSKSKNLIYSF